MEKISIITVTHNAEKFLEKTIQSVLSQSDKNFEYLIVDGASKDKTVEIIRKYEKLTTEVIAKPSGFAGNAGFHPHFSNICGQDARVPGGFAISASEAYCDNYKNEQFRWISESDAGLYDAMNKGIDLASGDFLWFMNSGDKIYDSSTLSKIRQEMRSNPNADIFYGQSLVIDENDNILGERHKIAPRILSKKSLLKGLVVGHQSILVRKSIAPYYDLKYQITADYDWVCEILSRSKQNVYIDDYLSRFMAGGVSSIHRRKSWKERFYIMKKHFGLTQTFFAHLIIAMKYPFTRKYSG